MVSITLDGSSTTVSGDGLSFEDGVLTITASGTYYITGTLEEGRIYINVDETEKVKLILAGVTITNSSDSPIYVESADKVIITLADGTVNTITDSDTSEKTDDSTRAPAAIYSCVALTINGSGTLNVSSSYNNAIGTKKTLKIVGGILNLTAENAGLKGNNAVDICGGTITIDSTGDGIKTEEEEDTTKGYVFISDGTITITTESDGINGSIYTIITGGTINITTTGTTVSTASVTSGSGVTTVSATSSSGESYSATQTAGPGGNQGNMGGNGGFGGNNGFADNTTSSSSPDSKGIKAGTELLITGGSITVSSTGHCVHSSGDVEITGGTINLTSSSGKGIQGHGDVKISGGTIIITKSTEGIESKQDMYISGGSTTLYATDDGINIGGTGYTLYISGGYVNVTVASGDTDGIDSNGSISITGGVTVVYKSGATEMAAALDSEYGTKITGGTVIVLGSSTSPSATVSVSYTRLSSLSISSGTYTVMDGNGNEVFTFGVATSASGGWIASEYFTSGTTYTITSSSGSTVTSWTQS